MKYKIVRADSASEMEEAVNTLISEGWIPCGGVSVHRDGYIGIGKVYYQALIKS